MGEAHEHKIGTFIVNYRIPKNTEQQGKIVNLVAGDGTTSTEAFASSLEKLVVFEFGLEPITLQSDLFDMLIFLTTGMSYYEICM